MDKNIICLKVGEKYSSDYVNILYNMCDRFITEPFRFICITDDQKNLNSNIETKPIINSNLHTWWHKVSVFNKNLYDLNGIGIFIDLDVVITNDVTELFYYQDDKFCIIRDWLHKNTIKFNSSIFKFKIGEYGHVYDNFVKNLNNNLSYYPGDQDYLTIAMQNEFCLWPKEWFLSYKFDNCWKKFDNKTKAIIFHGNPNPHEAIHGYRHYPNTPWIANYRR